jgi:hypothetical protein
VKHYFQDVSFYKLTKYWGGKHIQAFMLGIAQCSTKTSDGPINVTHFLNIKNMGASKHVNLVSLQFLLGILVDMLNIFP